MTNNRKRIASIKLSIDRFFNIQARGLDYALLALSLCFTNGVNAGVNAGELQLQTLDLHTAIMKSLEHNPALESVEYQLRSAEAYTQQAAVGETPEVSFSLEDAFGSGDFSGLDSSQSTLSISWILERSLLARRVDAKKSEENSVYVQQEIKEYDISAATAHTFLSALAFQERSKVSVKAVESAKLALRDVRKRTESGKAPIADLLRAEIELERRRLEIENITHELDVARRLLAAQWGATSLNFSTLSGSLILNGAVLDFSEMEQRIQQSPRVRLFLTQERVKQSELVLAEEEAKNRPRFKTGVRRIEQSDDYAVVFGLSIPFGGVKRNQARIAALSEEQAGLRADARAEKIKLSAKLYSLYEGYRHNVHLSDALEEMIIPRLEKALFETQKAYEVGRYSYREWSTVQQEVLAARLELIGSRLAAHSNAVELERLTGQPILTFISTDLED